MDRTNGVDLLMDMMESCLDYLEADLENRCEDAELAMDQHMEDWADWCHFSCTLEELAEMDETDE